MKEINYEALMALTFEIEGLLMLMRERGDDCPAEAEILLASKARMLAGYFSEPSEENLKNSEPEVETIETINDEAKEADPVSNVMQDNEEADGNKDVHLDVPTFDQIGFDQAIRLDEKLARDSARDLRRAFTLNDRFRFRRELFGNSENRLVEAIDIIDAMNSLDEAEEYFYGDLGWDRESDDVKDFMAIVANHFSSGE